VESANGMLYSWSIAMVDSDDLELQTARYIPTAVIRHLISRWDWIPGIKYSQLGYDKVPVKSLMLKWRGGCPCMCMFFFKTLTDLSTVLLLKVYTESCCTNSVLVGIGLL
jgi:hypothetical protein